MAAIATVSGWMCSVAWAWARAVGIIHLLQFG
jgi:hypothetical protein